MTCESVLVAGARCISSQGKEPVRGDVVDTTGSNWQDWLPVPVPMYKVPPVPSGHGAIVNPTVLAQLQRRKD